MNSTTAIPLDTLPDPPQLDADPFSDEVLSDPYPFFEQLRETGAVVRLSRYGVFAVGRYKEAFELVSDHSRFISSAGMGMSDIRKPGAWRTTSPISEIDPPTHTSVRKALQKILSPSVVRAWQVEFRRHAEGVVDSAVRRVDVDAVHDIAEEFVLSVFPQVLGIRVPRELFLAVGDMNFNQLGPNNERTQAAVARAQPRMAEYEKCFQRESALPGGFAEQIFAAEDAGDLLPGTASAHVRGFLRGGVDTTIAGIGFALNQLARDPAQWQLLRDDPGQVSAAFEEAVRFESPAQVLFRTAVEPAALGGYQIPQDAKIAYFIGAANRDPRKWPQPDRYDITRRGGRLHLGFGAGVHMCIGQMIARIEAESILGALAARVQRLELRTEPSYRLINTLRTLASLPLRLIAA